jgi:hypothetical protein
VTEALATIIVFPYAVPTVLVLSVVRIGHEAGLPVVPEESGVGPVSGVTTDRLLRKTMDYWPAPAQVLLPVDATLVVSIHVELQPDEIL